MFEDLIEAIKQNNHDVIATYLEKKPALASQTDENGNNITHIAAQYGDAKSLKILSKILYKNDLTQQFFQFNKQGNTPLHLVARYNDVNVVYMMTRLLSEKSLTEMAKVINDDDFLPLHLVQLNPREAQRKKIYSLLEPLVLKQSLAPLSELTNTKEVLSRYKITEKDNVLKANLYLACRVSNHARLLINESGTHPQVNRYSFTEKYLLFSRINKMRDDIELQETKNQNEFKYNILDQKNLDLHFEKVKKLKIGNCLEFSYCGLKILSLLEPTVRGEIFKLTSGDHAFLVIGRDPKTDVNDFKTWNSNTVVCDPWSGMVYLASEIPLYLRDYYKHNEQNIVAPINLHIQRPTLYFHIEPERESKLTFLEKIERASRELLPAVTPPHKKPFQTN